MKKHVIIIGGGIAGLSTAYHVQEDAHAAGLPITYTLLEDDTRVGGKIKTEHVDNFVIDGGPDCFLSRKPWAIELCRKLGLNDDLMGTNDDRRKTFVLNRGKLTPLPDGVMLVIPTKFMPFATSNLISWPGKMRMGMDLLIPPRSDTSDETVGDFVRRRLGQEALDKIAEPLMSAIHISDPEYQSLLGSFPLFRTMEQKHGSLIRAMLAQRKAAITSKVNGVGGLLNVSPDKVMYDSVRQITRLVGVTLPSEPPKSPNSMHNGESFYAKSAGSAAPLPMFMTLRQGLGQMVDAVAQALTDGQVCMGKRVVRVEHVDVPPDSDEPRYHVHTADGDTFTADAVVLATPSYVSADLLKSIHPQLVDALLGIPYVTTATVSMGFQFEDIGRPFDGFGFVIPRKEHRQITGCTWTSTKFNHRTPSDRLLLRCFIGGPGHEELAELPDDELVAMARKELQAIMGLNAAPVLTRVFRWSKANPQYLVGHLDRVREIHAMCDSLPGMVVTGSAFDGVGVPDCIHQGQKAAKKVLASLTHARAVGSYEPTTAH